MKTKNINGIVPPIANNFIFFIQKHAYNFETFIENP